MIVVAVGIRGALTIVRVCILIVEAAAVIIVEMIMCVAIASGRRRSRRGCHDYIKCSKDEMWLNKYSPCVFASLLLTLRRKGTAGP